MREIFCNIKLPFLICLFTFVQLGFNLSTASSSSTSADAKRLVEDLFDKNNYDIRVRPVIKDTTPTNVTIRMNLYMISDIDERTQIVQLYMWTVQMWRDEFLQWNPDDYGGINSVVVPYNMIWLPDTYLYNGVEMELQKTERRISVILTMENSKANILYLKNSSNSVARALVTFRYPAIYKFTCYMDIHYYPFDWQFCRMTFGSWMFDATHLDYFPIDEDVYLEQYIEHSEWSIISFKMKRVLKDYKCCVNPFSLLYADLILARKPWFSLVNLIIPTGIISFVSLFGITTLLTMSILLLMVSQEMPTTSDFIPLIGWFYLSVIILISCATFLSTIIIEVQLQARYERRIPIFWQKLIFGVIANKIFITLPSSIKRKQKQEAAFHREASLARHDRNYPVTYIPEEHHSKRQRLTSLLKQKSSDMMESDYENFQQRISKLRQNEEAYHNFAPDSLSEQVCEVKGKLRIISDYLKAQEAQRTLKLEWDCFATIIERLLMILFISLSLMVTVGIVTFGMYKGSFVAIPEDND
ncbi:Acetylcholine receptor [Trichinella pseudospiralis]